MRGLWAHLNVQDGVCGGGRWGAAASSKSLEDSDEVSRFCPTTRARAALAPSTCRWTAVHPAARIRPALHSPALHGVSAAAHAAALSLPRAPDARPAARPAPAQAPPPAIIGSVGGARSRVSRRDQGTRHDGGRSFRLRFSIAKVAVLAQHRRARARLPLTCHLRATPPRPPFV